MERAVHDQIDRMELKLDILVKKLAPEALEKPKK